VSVPPDQLVPALMAAGCRQVILVPDGRTNSNQNDLIDQFVGADIAVAIVPSLRRLPLYGLSTNYFFGKDLLLLQVRNNLARLPQRIFKRSIDMVGAVLLTLLLSPVFLVFAFLIWKEDRGPVFFRQLRVGRGGTDLTCWKFRTMVVDAEDQMARWKEENPVLLARYCESNFKLQADPRVTSIGAWMRRNSLDELPQLFNVLLGDMSLVGPRPLLHRELANYGAVGNGKSDSAGALLRIQFQAPGRSSRHTRRRLDAAQEPGRVAAAAERIAGRYEPGRATSAAAPGIAGIWRRHKPV
jgi:undecaprenyl-phosphate galactose phosphotransferase